MISWSSSTASSAPATSAKVVFGMSLETIFALDLPKFMMRLPPPCMFDMRKKNRKTMIAIGRRVNSSDTRMLSFGTSTL